MKTLTFALLLSASLAVVCLGCTDNSTVPPTAGNETIGTARSSAPLAKNGPIVHAVQGSTNGTFSGVYDEKVQNTFSAHQYADGSFGGQYMINARKILGADKAWKWNAEVVYLKVYTNLPGYGNFAVIGGIETTNIYAGSYELLFVVDRGPGLDPQTSHNLLPAADFGELVTLCNTPPDELVSLIGIETATEGDLRVY